MAVDAFGGEARLGAPLTRRALRRAINANLRRGTSAAGDVGYPRAAPVDWPMTSFGSIVFTIGFVRGG